MTKRRVSFVLAVPIVLGGGAIGAAAAGPHRDATPAWCRATRSARPIASQCNARLGEEASGVSRSVRLRPPRPSFKLPGIGNPSEGYPSCARRGGPIRPEGALRQVSAGRRRKLGQLSKDGSKRPRRSSEWAKRCSGPKVSGAVLSTYMVRNGSAFIRSPSPYRLCIDAVSSLRQKLRKGQDGTFHETIVGRLRTFV
jgi:hypothetical protein